MGNLKQSFIAGLFSIITIGILTLLTYKTEFGIFLIASFGSSYNTHNIFIYSPALLSIINLF